MGSLPPKTSENPAGPRRTPQNPAETPQNPRRDPAEPSERQISSESLAEGCASDGDPGTLKMEPFNEIHVGVLGTSW